MAVPNRVLLSELKSSFSEDNKIIRSKFFKQHYPEYVDSIKSESVYLDATIKAIETDSIRNMTGEWQIWSQWHIQWAKAMHTIYSRFSLEDGTFHAHCANLRQKRDYELSRLDK